MWVIFPHKLPSLAMPFAFTDCYRACFEGFHCSLIGLNALFECRRYFRPWIPPSGQTKEVANLLHRDYNTFLTSFCPRFELQSQARLLIFTLLGELEVLMGRQLQLQFAGLYEITNPGYTHK